MVIEAMMPLKGVNMEVKGISRAIVSANSNAKDALQNASVKIASGKPDPVELANEQENSVEKKVRAPRPQSSEDQTTIESKASQVAASIITAPRGIAVASDKTESEGLEIAEEKTSKVERILPENVGQSLNTEA